MSVANRSGGSASDAGQRSVTQMPTRRNDRPSRDQRHRALEDDFGASRRIGETILAGKDLKVGRSSVLKVRKILYVIWTVATARDCRSVAATRNAVRPVRLIDPLDRRSHVGDQPDAVRRIAAAQEPDGIVRFGRLGIPLSALGRIAGMPLGPDLVGDDLFCCLFGRRLGRRAALRCTSGEPQQCYGERLKHLMELLPPPPS